MDEEQPEEFDFSFHTVNEWVRLTEKYACDLSNPPGMCINKSIKAGHKIRHLKSYQDIISLAGNHKEDERILARNYICRHCWQKYKHTLLKHHIKSAKSILKQEHMQQLFEKQQAEEKTEEQGGN